MDFNLIGGDVWFVAKAASRRGAWIATTTTTNGKRKAPANRGGRDTLTQANRVYHTFEEKAILIEGVITVERIEVRNFEGTDIRIVVLDDSVEWVLSDLCKAIDLKNSRNVAARLDDDEKGVRLVDTLGGAQKLTTVTEAGLYTVLLFSDKPVAKKLRRWATHEVFPSIRKTGSYSVNQENELPKSNAEMFALAGKVMLEHQQRLDALESGQSVIETCVKDMSESMLIEPMSDADAWRERTFKLVTEDCQKRGIDIKERWIELYNELERAAGCRLNARVKRAKTRARNAGASAADVQTISKLAVIAWDKRLRLALDGIIARTTARKIAGTLGNGEVVELADFMGIQ